MNLNYFRVNIVTLGPKSAFGELGTVFSRMEEGTLLFFVAVGEEHAFLLLNKKLTLSGFMVSIFTFLATSGEPSREALSPLFLTRFKILSFFLVLRFLVIRSQSQSMNFLRLSLF